MDSITRVEGAPIALVGDTVCDREFLKGYNTYFQKSGGDGIIAATCGVVEIVEKVVSVRGLHPRYLAEVGDVVVGRITEVSGNRWKCCIGSPHHAVMMLQNVTEPGGVLRRRGRDDELTMRNIFGEGDIVVAEVQRLLGDGIVSLHTRSAEKFGKMQSAGLMVSVNPSLIRRPKSHFHVFAEYGVALVMGMNGKLWLSIASAALTEGWAGEGFSGAGEGGGGANQPTAGGNAAAAAEVDPTEARQNVSRTRNCIQVLDKLRMSIHPYIIGCCVDALVKQGIASRDTLGEQASQIIYTAAMASRQDLLKVGGNPIKRNRDE